MSSGLPSRFRAMLVRAGRNIVAFPLRCVVETMRPLTIEPVAGTPPFILGVSIVRGSAVPVVDLNAIVDPQSPCLQQRFVVVHCGERQVALIVDAVAGIVELDANGLSGVPPLLQDAQGEAVTALAVLDQQLLSVLEAARLVSEAVWQQIAERDLNQ